jgi:NIMA (never in mitosis gene a)-related kinase
MENFEILEKLGEGSYSTVYKVKRKIDNQIYALKKVKLSNLNEKEKTNSLNEVRILASVKSKYVISYKEAFFDEKDSTLGVVMEYADNGDLYKKILEYKQKKIYFEEIDIWKIFIQLVKGLKALHDLQILHRDLKSANVFLFKDGHAKLGDLNVSKVAKRGLGYTQTGTPYYASPEIWKDLPYDNKSDIWSLGCVLYEMITLHPPFRSKNMDELYKKVLSGDIGNLPEKYSNDLYEVVLLMMKVNSNKRPNCNDILNNTFVKKRIEYFKSMNNSENNEDNLNMDEFEEQYLLKTIHIPKNLLFLSNQLPKPNYKKGKNKLEMKINTNPHKKSIDVRHHLPKLIINHRISEESKNALTIIKQNSIDKDDKEKEDNTNDINNIKNKTPLDIKNEVQFYKKLYDINKKLIKPVKKNKSLEKELPIEYYNINNIANNNMSNNNINNNDLSINNNINNKNSNIFYNLKHNIHRFNFNNNISNKYKKLYKLYEPNIKINEVKKMPKYKILNSLRNNNNLNIYMKNREEIYKDLYKNVGIKSELIDLLHKNKSIMDKTEGNTGNFSQIKIPNEPNLYKARNRLSPISIGKKDDYFI